ncbi:hypothetical protein [Paracoccus fistulariae]|uniref:Uncharacterized protein n=1 Tax=Paracoccus fistulariae TaxID=658446 RepID=A0ABY7SNY7_9RHOB|nr:hypothetical protein [Paracoccus fistulariae]MDB6182318.1 hypothetical protein [Paracoccus fistulariae]WCR08701.1 hypothetical protein JHX87_07865 [Paracoccus fistulariae]
MERAQDMLYLAAVLGFVGSTLAYALHPTTDVIAQTASLTSGLLMYPSMVVPEAMRLADLPHVFLHPHNLVVWALLISLWALLVLDAIVRFVNRDSQDNGWARFYFTIALIVGAAWPWIYEDSPVLAALGAIIMLSAALAAAFHDSEVRRPAIGYFAGWSTGISMITILSLLCGHVGLSMTVTTSIVMVLAALFGIIVQTELNHRVSYAVALIFVFCGLTVATMGNDMIITLAAIFSIAAMTIMLIRAAS